MLEVVVSGAVVEPPDVERYIRCTLLAAMNDYQVGLGVNGTMLNIELCLPKKPLDVKRYFSCLCVCLAPI